MATSLCGVHMCNIQCRAHERSWKWAHENQETKQVTVVSLTTPLDKLYSLQYHSNQSTSNRRVEMINNGTEGMDVTMILERIAATFCFIRMSAHLSERNRIPIR